MKNYHITATIMAIIGLSALGLSMITDMQNSVITYSMIGLMALTIILAIVAYFQKSTHN